MSHIGHDSISTATPFSVPTQNLINSKVCEIIGVDVSFNNSVSFLLAFSINVWSELMIIIINVNDNDVIPDILTLNLSSLAGDSGTLEEFFVAASNNSNDEMMEITIMLIIPRWLQISILCLTNKGAIAIIINDNMHDNYDNIGHDDANDT